MRRALNIVAALIIMLSATTSCVHEWPDEGTLAPITLELTFITDLPTTPPFIYNPTKNTSEFKAYDMRYTIEAYRRLPDGSYAETPHLREVLSKDEISTLDYTADILLPDGDYKVMVWADYVEQGSLENLYYDNTDFEEIVLVGEHVGNTDYRDAFVGFTEFNVRRVESDAPAPVHKITMERPLAKIEIIATDITEFMERQVELLRMKQQEDGKAGDNQDETKGDGTKVLEDIDLENDFTVRVHYSKYMPTTFNMNINKPTDSKLGVYFDSKIKRIDETRALLGFDYVFVNGTESYVELMLEIYNKEGERIASTVPDDVTIVRGKLTPYEGEFLTSVTQGGVNINPGFEDDEDGEFIIGPLSSSRN